MNKNYLIIAILSVILAILCVWNGYIFFVDQTGYVSTNIGESGTVIEIPNDMIIKSNNNGITTLENDNTIIIFFNSANKGLPELVAYETIIKPIFGNNTNGNVTINNPNIASCSLNGECNGVLIGNNKTHDNIIVISKNKDIVNHIINSIIWGNKTSSSDDIDTTSNKNANSQPSAYAYKSDGTPMYSQKEVDDYMLKKYGPVDYHIANNKYIHMDEPGYDKRGNPIDD
ncbi:MAG: hypothetical protein MJ224_06660 [archaeon]|nr:hypothetical protein [archaeon]